jgi:phosphinothricin acetyltransferase
MRIRDATIDDFPQITAIYDREVESSTSTFDTEPLDLQQQKAWIELHQSPSYPLIVAVREGSILGWASLSPWSGRCAYARTVEASIYVHCDYRRQGIAQGLIEELIVRAQTAGHRVITGRIEASNEVSRRLLQNANFTSVGVMHSVGEKFGRILDVELFERILSFSD